jgi:hypothetical protein
MPRGKLYCVITEFDSQSHELRLSGNEFRERTFHLYFVSPKNDPDPNGRMKKSPEAAPRV